MLQGIMVEQEVVGPRAGTAPELVPRPPELAVVVPTFNEAANVGPLLDRLRRALAGLAFEIVVVDDDSPDGTAAAVRALAAADPRVRCLQRIGRRGLASACVEGMLASAAPCLAVIDADLQHDETLLPAMLAILRRGEADLVVGSRYLDGPDVPGWDRRRLGLSRLATALAKHLPGAGLSDPMSGFFMLRREVLDGAVRRLSATGFKILLDIVASSPEPLRIKELPYRFRARRAGESKLDGRAARDFAFLLLDKTLGRFVPARFVLFGLVGGLGVGVHLLVLLLLFRLAGLGFAPSQAAATLVAMTGNFALNNALTYRDRRLSGRAWARGWLAFCLTCSIGALANVGIAAQLFLHGLPWLLAALGGIVVGAVWNYAASAFYTWDGSGR
jgi:dolichol-phosphate mannosyltransferase